MYDLQKEDISILNLTKPDDFKQQLQILQDQLPSILDDFKKYFIFYNKNPEYPEYQRLYENIRSNLNNLNSKLFMISNNVESNTDDVNKKLIALDILIKQEKDTNKTLKRQLGMVEQKNDSTDEMIHNYKQVYDMEYLRNWALFLSIIACGFTISKIFNVKQ